jgi:hypothetical protein
MVGRANGGWRGCQGATLLCEFVSGAVFQAQHLHVLML